MNDSMRETLGGIWRLCEQMAYAAEHGHVSLLGAQYNALQRRMNQLDKIIEEMGEKANHGKPV